MSSNLTFDKTSLKWKWLQLKDSKPTCLLLWTTSLSSWRSAWNSSWRMKKWELRLKRKFKLKTVSMTTTQYYNCLQRFINEHFSSFIPIHWFKCRDFYVRWNSARQAKNLAKAFVKSKLSDRKDLVTWKHFRWKLKICKFYKMVKIEESIETVGQQKPTPKNNARHDHYF